jgi:hypothetical protein
LLVVQPGSTRRRPPRAGVPAAQLAHPLIDLATVFEHSTVAGQHAALGAGEARTTS